MDATEDASVGGAAQPLIEPLRAADLAQHHSAVLALSESAHWNQTAADWRLMLALGQGWAIWAHDGQGQRRLAASTLVLPYGEHFAWISMVLVLPNFRRRGYATKLLHHALQGLERRGVTAVLDATPAGAALYRQVGFADAWGFARYRRAPQPTRPRAVPVNTPIEAVQLRVLQESDWPALDAIDQGVFGASRLPLLRELARRLPGATWVAEARGRPCGLVLGRDGRGATQIGPLWAGDERVARALLEAALGAVAGPVIVDLLDRETVVREWLIERGFELQRPFMRMVRGAAAAPGTADGLVLVAGPELG